MEPKPDMINYMTCYKGSVEAWEIDHMGHMNVQFYLKKANHALKLFFLKNGINPANVSYRAVSYKNGLCVCM